MNNGEQVIDAIGRGMLQSVVILLQNKHLLLLNVLKLSRYLTTKRVITFSLQEEKIRIYGGTVK